MKILKNTTASSIFITDTGVTLPVGSTTVNVSDYPLFAASSDIITVIGNGSVIVNDGSFDLSKAAGIALIQGNFTQTDFIPSLKAGTTGNERLKVDVTGLTSANIQESPTALFFTDERAQDAVGNALVDSASVDFTYNDAANTITAALTSTGVTANTYGSSTNVPVFAVDSQGRITSVTNTSMAPTTSMIPNFGAGVLAVLLTGFTTGANAVISATDSIFEAFRKAQGQISALFARNINTGTGLSGGGNLSADRTLSIANTGVTAGTYGSANTAPVITVNAQGQVTAASNVVISAPYADHYNGTTQYAAEQLRVFSGTGTTDANGRLTFQLTTTGAAGGTALFTSVLTANAIGLDASGSAIQAPQFFIESISATQVVFRAIRGTSTGVLIGGTVVSAQYAGAGYTAWVQIIGVKN